MPIRYMPIVPSSGYMTSDQEAGMDANTKISALDPVASRSDIPTQLIEKPANQAAATYTVFTNAKSKYYVDYYPIIELPAGACTIDLTNIYTPITIKGDTRPLAGHAWIHGIPVYSIQTGVGVGLVTLTNSGNDITIACATTNPDFTGWGNGDRVVCVNTSGVASIHTILSISGNTITLTGTAPSINGYGSSVCLVPNRSVDLSSSTLTVAQDQNVTLSGFSFEGSSSYNALNVLGKSTLANSLIYDTSIGVNISGHGEFTAGAECAIIKGLKGIYTKERGVARITGTLINSQSVHGVAADGGAITGLYARSCYATYAAYMSGLSGSLDVKYCYGAKSTYGFQCAYHGSMFCDYATAQHNSGHGYYCSQVSAMSAPNTNVNNYGNGTNYGTALNNNCILEYS